MLGRSCPVTFVQVDVHLVVFAHVSRDSFTRLRLSAALRAGIPSQSAMDQYKRERKKKKGKKKTSCF